MLIMLTLGRVLIYVIQSIQPGRVARTILDPGFALSSYTKVGIKWWWIVLLLELSTPLNRVRFELISRFE